LIQGLIPQKQVIFYSLVCRNGAGILYLCNWISLSMYINITLTPLVLLLLLRALRKRMANFPPPRPLGFTAPLETAACVTAWLMFGPL
jgi:hypothetical protein